MSDLGNKPASEATYREWVAAMVLQGSVTCDGKLTPDTHAAYAERAAEALIARLEGAK